MVLFVRIDDRLIHGQVVEGWANYLKATCIIVADDGVAANTLQRSIMEISVPRGLRVLIGGVKEMCARLRTGILDKERVIMLFSSPVAALRALQEGLPSRTVNIGGMHYVPGKRKLLDVLAVDDSDVEALREITRMGVSVDVQTVPTGRPMPLDKVFKVCARTGTL